MNKSFAAPPRIRRIAARRVFNAPRGKQKQVVVTLGVPQAVPGSDWGCLLQMTGLNTTWRRPKYLFGIDGLHALHLQCAGAVLESKTRKLEWLGQTGDLGMPRFLPWLPKPQQDRLQSIIEREIASWGRRAERAHKASASAASRLRRDTGDRTRSTVRNGASRTSGRSLT